jgi:hypothetical protein
MSYFGDQIRMLRAKDIIAAKLADQVAALQAKLDTSYQTNRELNRRVGELTKALNDSTDRKIWHRYYLAALGLFQHEEEKRIALQAKLTEARNIALDIVEHGADGIDFCREMGKAIVNTLG